MTVFIDYNLVHPAALEYVREQNYLALGCDEDNAVYCCPDAHWAMRHTLRPYDLIVSGWAEQLSLAMLGNILDGHARRVP